MNYEYKEVLKARGRRDGRQISALLIDIGRSSPANKMPRRRRKNRFVNWLTALVARLDFFYDATVERFLDVTFRRKYIRRGRRRLMLLAGVTGPKSSFSCLAEKVGTIRYPLYPHTAKCVTIGCEQSNCRPVRNDQTD